jgi:hypothetical protein
MAAPGAGGSAPNAVPVLEKILAVNQDLNRMIAANRGGNAAPPPRLPPLAADAPGNGPVRYG